MEGISVPLFCNSLIHMAHDRPVGSAIAYFQHPDIAGVLYVFIPPPYCGVPSGTVTPKNRARTGSASCEGRGLSRTPALLTSELLGTVCHDELRRGPLRAGVALSCSTVIHIGHAACPHCRFIRSIFPTSRWSSARHWSGHSGRVAEAMRRFCTHRFVAKHLRRLCPHQGYPGHLSTLGGAMR